MANEEFGALHVAILAISALCTLLVTIIGYFVHSLDRKIQTIEKNIEIDKRERESIRRQVIKITTALRYSGVLKINGDTQI